MAAITPNTFDPLRRYVGVRLLQGVPLVDADWNELDDLFRFEFRAFLRWFIGSGVPANSDAFRVDGTGLANDFLIRRGVTGGPGTNNIDTGLRFAGHCLVDGYSVLIAADLHFTDQALHEGKGASADAEAARLGVPKIAAMATPIGPPPPELAVAVYLDAWERLVTPAEDPSLVLPALGTESCARLKREWAVRVFSGDADFISGHSYFLLATVARFVGQANVNASDVTDRRQTRLSLADLLARVRTLEQLTLFPSFDLPGNEFAPTRGPVGQPVNLSGRNFNVGSDVSVSFGGQRATILGTPTPTSIVAKVPASAAGNVRISVTTLGGTAVSTNLFNVVPAPTFASPPNEFDPKKGFTFTVVTLIGNNFDQPDLRVSFSGFACQVVGTPTATQIQIVFPSEIHSSQAAGFVVTTLGGTAESIDKFVLSAA